MKAQERLIKETQLKAQYKVLSEVEELWGVKPSNHRAYVFVTKKMRQIIKELQILSEPHE